MSLSPLDQISPPSDFKPILDAALSEYKKKTGKELLDDPLATELRRCVSVDAILAILHGQAKAFQQFRDGDKRLMKWIGPLVHVLFAFSETLGEGVSLAFPPAKAIFVGIGVLLGAAKDVSASHDALVDLFERIENFFKRLRVYSQTLLSTEMVEVFVKIVAEALSILSIATKEVKRKRASIYFRKLLGRTDIEDALKRLDGLIQEEVRMATAQVLRATIELKDDSKKANVTTANNIYEIKWKLIEQDIGKWFSPPDPSTNHNTACEVYHNVSPIWLFGTDVFKDWMSNGSLLWIHGKLGSGKSILCSAIIQYIMTLRDTGRATLAYLYFDFRDEEKQDVRNLVISLLVQLSAYSKPCCDILCRLYSAYGKGTQQPSNRVLMDQLKEMLTVAAQHSLFVIMDALDECPDSGMPTPREAVLNLVKDLIHLHLPNLHICVTSRPETGIQTKLKPLAAYAISLHEEIKQKNVIANYVTSVVSSDEYMKEWRDEDKKLVIEELSERADGMFQWVFSQLEALRHTVQPDVQGILNKLPRTLDETYERVLKNINENNQKHARRLLQCLAVAVRPLRIEELAEILAFDFDVDQGGIPKFHADRRPKDQEGALLSTCSSLIAVVENRGSWTVQFSHLSVKEFLTSTRLASSTGELSPYHILPNAAHTTLAQACLGLLLHLEDPSDANSVKSSPLAMYAALYWVVHAQFEDVASRVEDGMKSLFNSDKPHFSAWIGLYDKDTKYEKKLPSEIPSPLYYSALCGFHDLVRYLAVKHPHHVNAVGGSCGLPLVAALCRSHFKVAELLLEHGGTVDVRDTEEQTPLHKVMARHDKTDIDAVQFLLEHGADVNSRRDDLWTPLHLAVTVGGLTMARILLEHRADANSRNKDGQTPLHLLSKWTTSQDEDDSPDLAKSLLEYGANMDEKDNDSAAPLHLASYHGKLQMAQLLLDHGAQANAKTDSGETPLHRVSFGTFKSQQDGVRLVELLLGRGAEVDVQRKDNWTPLHVASYYGKLEIVRLLLNQGAKVNAETDGGETPLHRVTHGKYESQEDCARAARLLLERGGDANAQRKDHSTPLHLASHLEKLEIARLLLDHGAKVDTETIKGETPLHVLACGAYKTPDGVRIARLLLERGADVNAQRKDHRTPLHVASSFGNLEIARLLLDHGAKVDALTDRGNTPLHNVVRATNDSEESGLGVARLLLKRGAEVNAKDTSGRSPLDLVLRGKKPKLVQLLLKYSTSVNGQKPRTRLKRADYSTRR